MAIEFRCTNCGTLLRVQENSAGKKAKCPQCETILDIPPSSPDSTNAPPGNAPMESPATASPSAASPSAASLSAASLSAASLSAAPPATPAESGNPFQSPMAAGAAGFPGPSGLVGGEHQLASRLKRLAGALVDGLINSIALVPGIFAGVAAGMATQDENIGLAVGALTFFVGVFAILVYQWYLISTTGQSIAKRLLGMRIVRIPEGVLPGFLYGVVLRNWVAGLISFIPYLGSLFALVNVLFIFGEQRRCVHDHIAGTIVIDT